MKPLLAAATLIFIFTSCKENNTVFTRIEAAVSQVEFNNKIHIYDSFNILNTEFIYNGAGVAIGDLNGDGLEDLYFAGNQVDNACYINLGGLKFKDITKEAQVQKYPGQWSSGVCIIDFNADGKNDIYVCNTLLKSADLRKKLLFINQGNVKGIPVFKEEADKYGVADTSHASHAQFFDFDRDGDLDLFIGTNFIDRTVPGQFVKDINNDCNLNCDKLYRNDWDSQKQHVYYTEISNQAGLNLHGYTHSSLIYDFNKDGWQDIYVANDYLSDDLIYINNQSGTFSNKAAQIFRHQSSSAMGSDLGDINNDGHSELITVEMLPFTNLRKKTLIGPANYSSYIYIKEYGYQYQYTRNTLQLNQGIHPSTQLPVYSDIGFLSGVYQTEWSWAPLFADFDLDGYEDLYITNGFPKDVTDHDFGEYRNMTSNLLSHLDLQYLIPEVKVSNFMFKNTKDLKFADVSTAWGLSIKSFSNGAAYGDLDNDGDLDIVVNNIDDAPFIFKNNTIKPKARTMNSNYFSISLKGIGQNRDAFGALVKLYIGPSIHTRSVLSSRGYLSQSSNRLVFGLDTIKTVDSIQVNWPDGSQQIFASFLANQVVELQQSSNLNTNTVTLAQPHTPFEKISPTALGIAYKHDEIDFIDFNIQKTLPHKLSQYGVPMAVGDVNNDGADDFMLGGSANKDEVLFTQTKDGKFIKKILILKSELEKEAEDAAIVLLDVDQDQDLDLVIAGGSYENLMAKHQAYSVRYYQNDGKGNFIRDTVAIPTSIRTCASTLRFADIDLDGDQDLFIGGQVLPGYYPKQDKSFILLNQSSPGKSKFEDVTSVMAPDLSSVGMINDAIFTDFNNDHRPDLILAVEWGPISILQNTGQGFQLFKDSTLIRNSGWWSSITSGDFDNDGDMDYIAGNYGENVYFQCNTAEPISIYAKDFDQNGSLDPFISCYWSDTLGQKKEYFFHGRDEMIKQLITIRRKFKNYASFGLATVQDVFTPEELKGSLVLKANNLSSVMLKNHTSGGMTKFEMIPLPQAAQLAPLYGMYSQDLNDDEYLDLIVGGNDYGIELIQGRADAMQGLVLLNDRKGGFRPQTLIESGYFSPGDSKSLIRLHTNQKSDLFINMINLDSLIIHRYTLNGQSYLVQTQEYTGVAEFSDGKKRKTEYYSGNSYKGQSSAWHMLPPRSNQITLQNARVKTVRSIKN